ncbi:MAG: putative metalloprotease CJM1_0395 family protein [Fibrobacterales bacterium]
MITDFVLNPSVRGLRANSFGSAGEAVPVSGAESVVDFGAIPENAQKTQREGGAVQGIAQNAYSLALSPEAQALLAQQAPTTDKSIGIDSRSSVKSTPSGKETSVSDTSAKAPIDDAELSEEEQAQVTEMKARDQEVRTHEQSHLAAAGPNARGGVKLEYESGPDGKQYAVSGHVDIDVSKADTPEETITKAEQIQQAALAPAEPSSKDRQVAAEATQLESEAREELREETHEGVTEVTGSFSTTDDTNEGGHESLNQNTSKNEIIPTATTRSLQSGLNQRFNGYQSQSGGLLNIVA